MAQEYLMVKPEEFNQLVQYYEGHISDSALLNKAGRTTAEDHALLGVESVSDSIANAKIQELLPQKRRFTKRLRDIPNIPSVGMIIICFQFIRHLSQMITQFHLSLSRSPFVKHRIRVVIQDAIINWSKYSLHFKRTYALVNAAMKMFVFLPLGKSSQMLVFQ